MNLRRLFRDFNPSKFLLFSMLLLFSILLALRLDGTIKCNFWAVFIPIWIWKFLVVSGAVVGIVVWIRHPEYRREGEDFISFKAMIICLSLHISLLMFEILVCVNLEGRKYPWRLVFMPLYFMSPLSIIACIWSFRHDRSAEFETIFAVNMLQFVFLSLRLDGIIVWSWVVVFVPMWIIMSVLCLLVMYYVIWSIVFVRTAEVLPAQRRGHIMVSIASVFLVLPLLVFQILLCNRLDGLNQDLFVGIVAPLQISLISLLATTFYHRGGNHWWFGIRKDFCDFVLELLPCLQEYGNIAYKFPEGIMMPPEESEDRTVEVHDKQPPPDYHPKPVVPITSIEMPD